MKTNPAICIDCGKVRNLSHGNPRPCICGSKRIVWVGTTVDKTRALIKANYERAGLQPFPHKPR